jgi:hypothetical protein
MIKKDQLVEIIEKYHLNGVVETVKWKVEDNKLLIDFIVPNQDALGQLVSSIELPNCEIGIYNTSRLLKLLSILDKEVLISIENQINPKLKIEDANYTLYYSLADTDIIPDVPEVNIPKFDVEFKINNDVSKLFNKAKSALGAETKEVFQIFSCYKDTSHQVKIILGDPNSHSNKIEFYVEAIFEGVPSSTLMFSSAYFSGILDANKDKEGTCYLSEEGLMYIKYDDVYYYLTKLED